MAKSGSRKQSDSLLSKQKSAKSASKSADKKQKSKKKGAKVAPKVVEEEEIEDVFEDALEEEIAEVGSVSNHDFDVSQSGASGAEKEPCSDYGSDKIQKMKT